MCDHNSKIKIINYKLSYTILMKFYHLSVYGLNIIVNVRNPIYIVIKIIIKVIG